MKLAKQRWMNLTVSNWTPRGKKRGYMDTEARKRRRKRNMYRNKLKNKEHEMEQIVARATLLKLTGDDKSSGRYEISSLVRQKEAVVRKIARLQDILASLSPEFGERKGNTS